MTITRNRKCGLVAAAEGRFPGGVDSPDAAAWALRR
jgi:hypothetical protein